MDPDERMPNDGPRWGYYVEMAEAAIAALWPLWKEQAAGVVKELAAKQGVAECCGNPVGGYHSPPECCGDPDYMISDRAVDAAIRDMEMPK
jgi:hypothetical protein